MPLTSVSPNDRPCPVQSLHAVTLNDDVAADVMPAVLRSFVAVSQEQQAFFHADIAKSGLSPSDVPDWFPVRGEGIKRYCGFAQDTDEADNIGLDDEETFGSGHDEQASIGAWTPPDGFAIPYRSLDGEPILGDGGQPFLRFRLQAALTQAKREDGSWKDSGKYVSAKGASWHIYVPRGTASMLLEGEGDDLPIIITEGEKKAEALVKHIGVPAVALPGIHMWFDPESDRREDISKRSLHPELSEILDAYADWCTGKPTVLVLFDSDGRPFDKAADGLQAIRAGKRTRYAHNPDVYYAAATLAKRVYTDRSMAVASTFAFCPAAPDGGKQGADDWIQALGVDAVLGDVEEFVASPLHKIINDSNLPAHYVTGNFAKDTDALQKHLKGHEHLFVFGDKLCSVSPDRMSLDPIDSEATLARRIAEVVQPFVENSRGAFSMTPPPQRMCAALMAENWSRVPGMRVVDAIATQPVPMLWDSKLVLTPEGYDAGTRIFGAFNEGAWNVGLTPSASEVNAARSAIAELLDEMYLQAPCDVAALLAAIFTAVCRPGLPVAPGFVLSAPNSGAGKSYIAQMLALFAGESSPEILTLDTRGPNSDTEINKLLLASLMGRSRMLWFDEINGPGIDSPSLRKLITAETYSGRRLGSSQTLTLQNRKLVVITANNVDPTQDSARRFIILRINPPRDASRRKQSATHGALEMLEQDRERYVRAAITLLAGAWHELERFGRKRLQGVQPLSGFPIWWALCGLAAAANAWRLCRDEKMPRNLVDTSAIASIGKSNPLEDDMSMVSPTYRQLQIADADPARQALRALLEGLYAAQQGRMRDIPSAVKHVLDGKQAWTAAMLVEELREQRRLAERYAKNVNSDIEPESFALLQELRTAGLREDQLSNVRSLSQVLGRYRDKAEAGYQLHDMGQDRHATWRWHVTKVE